MERINRVLLAQLGIFLLVPTPWVVWALVKTYYFNDPDIKFGETGGIIFALYFYGIAGFISSICFIFTCLFNSKKLTRNRFPAIEVLFIGGLLSLLANKIPVLPVFPWVDEIYGLIISWVIVSLVTSYSGIILLSKFER